MLTLAHLAGATDTDIHTLQVAAQTRGLGADYLRISRHHDTHHRPYSRAHHTHDCLLPPTTPQPGPPRRYNRHGHTRPTHRCPTCAYLVTSDLDAACDLEHWSAPAMSPTSLPRSHRIRTIGRTCPDYQWRPHPTSKGDQP